MEKIILLNSNKTKILKFNTEDKDLSMASKIGDSEYWISNDDNYYNNIGKWENIQSTTQIKIIPNIFQKKMKRLILIIIAILVIIIILIIYMKNKNINIINVDTDSSYKR